MAGKDRVVGRGWVGSGRGTIARVFDSGLLSVFYVGQIGWFP